MMIIKSTPFIRPWDYDYDKLVVLRKRRRGGRRNHRPIETEVSQQGLWVFGGPIIVI